MQLKDQVIVVTGASRGLGRAMARRFGEEGAVVICASRTESELTGLVGEIKEKGGRAVACKTDISNEDDVKELIAMTIGEFGVIDTFVNNAAVSERTVGGGARPFVKLTKQDWDTILGVNLTGTFLCCLHVLPHMLARGHGNIINISSGRGQAPRKGIACYVVSKHALEGLNKQLAFELKATGINVNCLVPGGAVITSANPQRTEEEKKMLLQSGRGLPPEMINEAAVFLASQEPFGVSGKSFEARTFNEMNFPDRQAAVAWLNTFTIQPPRSLE